MGIDAVALIRCTRAAIRDEIGARAWGDDYPAQLRKAVACAARGEEPPLPLALAVLGVGSDFVRLFTAVRYRDLEADPLAAQALARRIVELLPAGAHEEPELLFYPDVAEPAGRTYAELVAAVGSTRVLASTAPFSDEQKLELRRRRERALSETLALLQGATDRKPRG